MIDTDGYRANVGIILCNPTGQVMWARRVGQDAWQFPQGGISPDEVPEEAMYRELWEETGLQAEHVSLLAATDSWLRYKLPKRLDAAFGAALYRSETAVVFVATGF